MSQFSAEEIYQELSKIVEIFPILECDRCAKAIIEWLEENGISYKIVRLRTRYADEDYIVSDRLERRGITEAITVNGRHYGIEVQGRVFDNISTEGLSRDDWLNDFHCPSEQFIIEEIEEL